MKSMEKFPSPPSSVSEGSLELQCVGRLEITRPKPVGFLCGSIPVPTDKSFHVFNSAIISSSETVKAPRYQMLPTQTDLNMPPHALNFPEKGLPIGTVPSKNSGDPPWKSEAITEDFSRKCESLAVSGLVEYGDQIDVIAPTDILKQIFKMPYTKARLSIAVHRVGQTLVLNTGPDVEEGEKLVQRHNNQSSKCVDQSLLLNFAMHSVRVEACDCPPNHNAPSIKEEHTKKSTALPRLFESSDGDSSYSNGKKDNYLLGGKKIKKNKGLDASIQKASSQVGEKLRGPMQESEKCRRVGNDQFLRVLFWQFHNFRMLLGSDMLIFSNEKYASVSLHLWDVTRKVTPLTWLEAWLDNVMASVPEVAICYHQNGVVQGYELLKTDDIFLLKGISEDGTPAFHPHVVQQNGLSVLRFLQKNCEQDPGAYWLYKNAGEDVIQLFDLSVIPKNNSCDEADESSSPLPSIIHRNRSGFICSLGTLLYRIAHRLSLSMDLNNRAKCAKFFKNCLDFLDEPDHLVVRALAHEQYARLILSCEEELDMTSESLPHESEIIVSEAHEDTLDGSSNTCKSIVHENVSSLGEEDIASCDESISEKMTMVMNISDSKNLLVSEPEFKDSEEIMPSGANEENMTICETFPTSSSTVETITNLISSKLAAVHHVSLAIKSLRWMRQLQNIESDTMGHENQTHDKNPPPVNFSVCACGDADCIEVCDIREWLPTSKLDHKLWKLVLLLGESYLALGQAYKDGDQLHRALKIVELACSVYGSMPQHLENTKFISSMICSSSSEEKCNEDDSFSYERYSLTYLFWAKAWTLVGDVYVEFHIKRGKDISKETEEKASNREIKMPSEVVKEVKRLKKKLGLNKENCTSCSLINCSCQSDRVSSGSSASSSSGNTRPLLSGRKQNKKSHTKKSDSATEKLQVEPTESKTHIQCENGPSETSKVKSGGIFKYLQGPVIGDSEYNLKAAKNCYEETKKALRGFPCDSVELQSAIKKLGWVFNELGRNRLERKELDKAELAFADAINAFKKVSDHTNIILINCNLGHGRRALAEEMLTKMENLKKYSMLHDAYTQVLETVKLKYGESLRYYGAAKSELHSIKEGASSSVSNSLRNEVYTQYAHTYLRLGMLLARENTLAEIYENGNVELRKREISANDAIREALSMYESLGDLRKQEAAYAYFQLACYQRDNCLKFLETVHKERNLSNGENVGFQRAKQYSCLAERNWQKAIDFYGPNTHPSMYLTILMERAELLLSLSTLFHSNALLDSALSCMFEGQHISTNAVNENPEIYAKFWTRLQMLLKKMLIATQSAPSNYRKNEVEKLRELYKMALKSTDLVQFHAMFNLWVS